MQLSCPNCDAGVRADDINLDRFVAKCHACHMVFRFDLDQEDSAEDEAPRRKRIRHEQDDAQLPLSQSIKLARSHDKLTFTRRWWSPVFIFLVFFCVFWDGFLFVWYSMAIGEGSGGLNLIMILFPMLHVAVGVGLTYYTIAGFLNTTTIEVTQGVLSVQHAPLPWPGNRKVPVDQLEQLYCKEAVNSSENGTSYTYELHALLTDGQSIKLVGGLQAPEDALFLERESEEYLGIEDRPVLGELQL